MLKQLVSRKTLTGNWEGFTFTKKSRYFLVKNLTEGDIFVSFENNDQEANSVKIKSGVAEEMSVTFDGIDKPDYYVNAIYVKGTGEVEVQALDTYATFEEGE